MAGGRVVAGERSGGFDLKETGEERGTTLKHWHLDDRSSQLSTVHLLGASERPGLYKQVQSQCHHMHY